MAKLILPGEIKKWQKIQYFNTPTGHTVLVLPTCSVPLEHLIEENWVGGHAGGFGNRRKITRVSKLRNGKKFSGIDMLWVKDPERIFSAEKGRLWWGGYKSSEKGIEINNNPLVEAQVNWEARYLIGLFNEKIKAEEPQAIIIHKDGSKSLITKDRFEKPGEKRETEYDKSVRKATKAGALPEDTGEHNTITDEEGNDNIIDTNRWGWKKTQYNSTKHAKLLIKALNVLRRKKQGKLIFKNY